jgi:L-rhamnose isomerase
MQWLKRFLSTDDPIVKLLAAMTEPEAQMRKELLEHGGVAAMVKNTGVLQSHLQLPFSQDYDLYVKRSDSEIAEEILGALMDTSPGDDEVGDGNGAGDGTAQ